MKAKILMVILLANWNCVMALTEAEQGLQIVEELKRRDTGFDDIRMQMQMILKNRNGDESTRLIKMRTLEVDGDGDKTLTIFDTPRDLKGTAFLSVTHALVPDDQWLYLPALKRVKRISSSNKSGPFLGSEYAFEDLNSFEVAKFKYQYLREEEYLGRPSFVLEFYPQYEYSGYTREVVWIDKERYIPMKIDYYDRKNDLLKTLLYIDYQQYLEQYWRANQMLMSNHQTGKSTKLIWQDYQFRTGLTDRDFDRNTLKRAR